MPVSTDTVCGKVTFTDNEVLFTPAIVGLPVPLYPTQKLVELAVPNRVKTQFSIIMAVLIPELIKMASLFVLTLAPVKLNATFPKE